MRRWLITTKERDYSSEIESDWIDLDKKNEVHYVIDHHIEQGDKVLVYKSGQWTSFSHFFEVKSCSHQAKGEYLIHLHQKKKIPKGIKLAELKNEGIINTNRKFKKRIYKVPLCCWSDIVGYISKKHPEIFVPHEKTKFKGPDKRGYPKVLEKEFYKTINDVRKLRKCPPNEEATKYRIILPILEAMGFDIYNPQIVDPEYLISERFADYTLTDYNSNNILLEAKKPSLDMDGEPEKQIRWYCASQNINQGILTNGIKWRFYNFEFYEAELGAIKKMRYKEIDILRDKKEKIFKEFKSFLWNNNVSNYKPKKFKESLSKIFQEMKQESNLNESAVKQAIVIPVLENLKWDPSNEKEFIFNPHTKIKVKKKKKILEKTIRPDYALINHKKICIEAKAMGIKNLDDHAGHVKAYCEKKRYDVGVATDGRKWNFLLFERGKYLDEKQLDIGRDSEKKFQEYFKKYLSKD